MIEHPTVLVVDDEAGVRAAIRAILEEAGYRVTDHASAEELLADRIQSNSCVIADVRMQKMDGLELQEEITRRGLELPVIIVTGRADVPLAVRAMKSGAIDFLEKPFDADVLLASVRRALQIGKRAHDKNTEIGVAQKLIASLTPRERDVLDQIVAGHPNKIAAYELGISPRTIEVHRAKIMGKMHARSLSELVRTVLTVPSMPAGG